MYSLKRRQDVFNKFNGRCYLCGETIDIDNYHMEHKIPKSQNGKTEIGNLYPACCLCNMTKGPLLIEEFREKIANIQNSCSATILMSKYHLVTVTDVIFYFEIVSESEV